MFRSAVVTAALCALTACDRATPTAPSTANPGAAVTPSVQTLRGIVRLVADSTGSQQVNLELLDGSSMIRLIGDPVTQLAMFDGQQVTVSGVYNDGVLLVESYSTEIYPTDAAITNRRRG